MGRIRKRKSKRRLQFEQLEARYVFDGASLAGDVFELRQNGPQVALDVLANDHFDPGYAGLRRITSVSYGSEGGRLEISSDGQRVLYTPPADFFGMEKFVYAVDGAYTAEVTVSIESPLSFDRYTIPPDGQEHVLDVLANDPFWAGYEGPRRITSVSVGSQGGSIIIGPDGRSILYTRGEDAEGSETFIYVVDELYPAQVTVALPEATKGDRFEFVKYEPPRVLDVLANDPFWAGYSGSGMITHVTGSQIGATIEIANDGRSLIYTQPTDFGDRDFSYSVYDSFTYVVDGHEATVTITLHRPVKDDSFEVDENSSGFVFNVTLNDRYGGPYGNLFDVIDRVTSVTQSANGGTVAISPDGQGIVYTPAAGFSGADSFAYTADGVHIARVNVQVTRPVRDDNLYSGVYQDTLIQALDVLANDFLGNGYTGPRIITEVGSSSHGGTVTISSDGKKILYTPAAGYTGEDSFTYTVDGALTATVALNVSSLAQADYVTAYPDPHLMPYTVDVLENDFFGRGYAGQGVITSVQIVTGSGQISIQNDGKLLFDPDAAGSYLIKYVVDGQYEGTANVTIRNVAFADEFVVDQNSDAQQLGVLANDFYLSYPYYSYQGPRLITGVTQSVKGGVVTIGADGKSVHYEPAADFVGTDTFTYTVDSFMTATVTVEVIRRVRDDQFRIDAEDGSQKLRVLVNDPLGANYSGPGQITAVSATSGGGTVSIAADGHTILYTPAAGFSGTDTFVYTVDGAHNAEVSVVVDTAASEQGGKFGSFDEYVQMLIDDAIVRYGHLFGQQAWTGWQYHTMNDADFVIAAASLRGHSQTNVQVAGVDEGDIVEFDSDYVYMFANGELVIVNAWPAEEMSVASRMDIEGRPVAMFLHGDRLTVISELGGGYSNRPVYYDSDVLVGDSFWPWQPPQPSSTVVTVFDVSDRSAPSVVQRTEMEGKFVDSRGVGDFVYVLVNNANAIGSAPQIIDDDGNPETPGRYETREEYLARVTANSGEFVEAALPEYTTYGADGEMVRSGVLNMPEDIYRPLVPDAANLISVVSFNVISDEPGVTDTSAVYSTGASTIYASLDNFYVLDGDYSAEDGATTRIVKFDWEPETGGVEFAATTTVAGTILNQFSMDENDGDLRIATTVSNDRSGNWSGRDENVLFVLREDDGVLEFVGGLKNLALDETMRSVRFLGDRAFITTFRTIDPMFAIDLSDSENPESVGHITLPGFTSYMQLIDENHLLTVGRNTPDGTHGPTQVSLFDISNLARPRRVAEYTFERFTTSEAEIDHHAFGYYAEHGLLGMPVSQTRVERVDTDGDGYRETRRTVREDLLAVFTVDVDAPQPAQRLVLAGEIAHGSAVRRSGYIGDKLYSIAEDSVKVVSVSDPGTLVGELVVSEPMAPEAIGPPLFVYDDYGLRAVPNTFFSLIDENSKFALTPVEPSPLEKAIAAARGDLAERLGREAGSAMLVTAEAAGAAGAYYVVLQIDGRNFLYLSNASGAAELVEGGYDFASTSGAWNAINLAVVAPVSEAPESGGPTVDSDPSVDAVDTEAPVTPTDIAVDRAIEQLPHICSVATPRERKFEVRSEKRSQRADLDGQLLLVLAESSIEDDNEESTSVAERQKDRDKSSEHEQSRLGRKTIGAAARLMKSARVTLSNV